MTNICLRENGEQILLKEYSESPVAKNLHRTPKPESAQVFAWSSLGQQGLK
jgi:hypothetical protein